VFTPEIFTILRDLKPGAGGEIQLADAIDQLAREGKVSAVLNAATRYDCV
jgi:UTP--glucose-1-phosphate uridylyltransferase